MGRNTSGGGQEGIYFRAACLYSEGVSPVTFLKADAKAVRLLNPTLRHMASIVNVELLTGSSKYRQASRTRLSVSRALKLLP